MSQYVQFTLEDGSKVLVETAEGEGEIIRAEGSPDETNRQAAHSFEQGVAQAHKSALVVLKQIVSDNAPDELEITFGLKAAGELGGAIVIARASVEANYSVKMTWRKPKHPQPLAVLEEL